jgi:hypothetical protein
LKISLLEQVNQKINQTKIRISQRDKMNRV